MMRNQIKLLFVAASLLIGPIIAAALPLMPFMAWAARDENRRPTIQ